MNREKNMSEWFNVVFSGEIAGRADPALVRVNVGKLFNASDAVLDRLFSGQPVAVKKKVDRATAMKIRALMKQAGANATMVAVDEQGQPLGAEPAKPPPPPANSMAARVAVLAEQHEREEAAKPKPNAPPPPADVTKTSTWALFPVGSRLSVPSTLAPIRIGDISKVTFAAAGTDMIAEHEKPKVEPVKVDISGMTMAEAGTDVLKEEERRKVEPVKVDISGMSMAEVGAPLDEIRDDKPPVKVDISHISLV